VIARFASASTMGWLTPRSAKVVAVVRVVPFRHRL
jgi:hypothetical protein